MTFTQRSLSTESDKYRMAALARQFSTEHFRVTDLPYRLSAWSLDDPDNARLWFDEKQELVAWAVLQTPFWSIDITCQPELDAQLLPEILAWADQRACVQLNTPYGHPAWFVNVFSGQTQRIRILEQAGFGCQSDVGEYSWSKVFMRLPGQASVKVYAPPPGFVVRSLAGEAEAQAYVDLHQSVFESKNMTVEWRQRTLQHPAYRQDLDVVVVAPDGRLAAFCICWLNQDVPIGQVEPLGCHKDFRRHALGRVALSAGLRRLQSLGVENIFVETDNYRNTAFQLYESMGFQVAQDVLVYRKDYTLQQE